ncbi:MAG: DUF1573 domain-containing protein [Saprospiraceae bacterium]|nr:DUF1573 domain-containing protein [Saprospiraceae bacterium]
MLKSIKSAFFAVAVLGLLASCQNASNDVRDAARQDIESNAVAPTTNIQSAVQTPNTPTGPTTTMAFSEERFSFGTVAEGEKVSHTYKFTNTGNEPLILSNARGSCGCTVPKWPREPIAPGQSSEITVEFNTANKRGNRSQKVTITANTNPAETFIYLEGEVIATDAGTDMSVNN